MEPPFPRKPPEYIDGSLYPELPRPPDILETDEARADYVERVCAAWDFDILPERKTVELLRGWKDIFDRFPLPESPAYHTFREVFGWEDVPKVYNPFVRMTWEIQDNLEGRAPDDCINLI